MAALRVPLIIIFLTIYSSSEGQRKKDRTEYIPLQTDSAKLMIGVDSGTDVTVSAGVKSIPEFPGGKEAWKGFLRKNINLAVPLINKAPSGTYIVIMKITIAQDSSIRNIHVESHTGYGLDAEVMRVVRLSPKWKPAEAINGRKISFAFRVAVSFRIKEQTVEIL